MNYVELQDFLMRELRLYHYPVAIKFLYTPEDVAYFTENVPSYFTPMKSLSFCQWEVAVRMEGKSILGYPDKVSCSSAQLAFNWKTADEGDIKYHMRFADLREDAEKIIHAKPQLKTAPLAIALTPLKDAHALKDGIDTVHFFCDSQQARTLINAYIRGTKEPTISSQITPNSVACSGSVYSFMENTLNTLPACNGSASSGKTERGETNVMIPGKKLAVLYEALKTTSEPAGLINPDVCKNCPLIVFKKEK